MLKKILNAVVVMSIALSSLNASSLGDVLDNPNKKLKIGIIGIGIVGDTVLQRYKVSDVKSLQIDVARLKMEMALIEALKHTNIDLKFITIENIQCFPTDKYENADTIDYFHRIRNTKFKAKVARENNVDLLIYVSYKKHSFKRYLYAKSDRYDVIISLFFASTLATKYQSFSIMDKKGKSFSQNKIQNIISKKITRVYSALIATYSTQQEKDDEW